MSDLRFPDERQFHTLPGEPGHIENPLPTLFWPDDDPPPVWWGYASDGTLTKNFRSYKDYCDG